MQRPALNGLLAVLVGTAVGVSSYLFVGYASLAVVSAVCWTAVVWLVGRVGRLYPAYATGERWRDKRWTGLSVGVVTLAALLGVSPTLPLSSDLRLGLGILILGAGLAAYTAGSLAVLERTEAPPTEPPSASDGGYSVGED